MGSIHRTRGSDKSDPYTICHSGRSAGISEIPAFAGMTEREKPE